MFASVARAKASGLVPTKMIQSPWIDRHRPDLYPLHGDSIFSQVPRHFHCDRAHIAAGQDAVRVVRIDRQGSDLHSDEGMADTFHVSPPSAA